MPSSLPSAIGKPIEFTDERRTHIVTYHPDAGLFLDQVGDTLLHPDTMRRSSEDPDVVLFYKFFPDILNGKYMVVVVKKNGRCFILTVYLASSIRTGEPL